MNDLIRIAMNLPMFALVLCRISGIMLAAPVFSNLSIPVRIKAALTVLIGLIMFPVATQHSGPLPAQLIGYLPLAVTEVGLGLIMGLAAAMIIGAGGIMSQQIGLAMASVAAPDTSNPMSAISGLLGILGLLLFIVMDGHHWFIQALAISYTKTPLGQVAWRPVIITSTLAAYSNLFVVAIRVAAPIVGIMFLVTVMIALLAKSVPQMNILMVGLPVKISIGVVCMAFTLPFTLPVIRDAFSGLQAHLIQLARYL